MAVSHGACTDDPLQPKSNIELNTVDNLLELQGEFCTDPPRPNDFPVKILFIIDGSGSMQFVDPNTLRARAVEEAITRLRVEGSAVSFGIIRFNESDVVLTKPGAEVTAGDPLGVDLSGAFTQDFQTLASAVGGLDAADSVTDYQGALSTAFNLLAQDMIAVQRVDPAELARTRYILLFLSDGDPFPSCCSVESEDAGLCRRDTNIFFCEDPEAIRQNPTQLPFIEAGVDYNQPYQIFDVVRDIMELGENFGVGEIRLNTAFLFDESLADNLDPNGCFTIGGVNFVCPDEARDLLGTMASIGQGVFRDFSTAEEIDFLSFDITSIRRDNVLANFIVSNDSYIATSQGLREDTDGDGLPDEVEFNEPIAYFCPNQVEDCRNPNPNCTGPDGEITCRELEGSILAACREPGVPTPAGFAECSNVERLEGRLFRDVDGDGLSDRIEFSLRRNGLNPSEPNPGCDPDDLRDIDLDGLNACEEELLRTSTDLFDTDADGIPDGVEVQVGTEPREPEVRRDSDLDGRENADEIRFHTGVGFNEASERNGLNYRYVTQAIGENDQGGQCYAFEIRNIQLGTPLERPGDDGSFSRNDIYLYMVQDDGNVGGSIRAACVQARYVAPDFKEPLIGRVNLTPADFLPPEDDDYLQNCLGLNGLGVPVDPLLDPETNPDAVSGPGQ